MAIRLRRAVPWVLSITAPLPGASMLAASSLPPPSRTEIKRPGLAFETRVLLNSALVNRASEAAVLVAAASGELSRATQAFERLGGNVDVTLEAIDYLRGHLDPARLEELSREPSIVDLQIDHGPAWLAPNWNWDTDADYWRRTRLTGAQAPASGPRGPQDPATSVLPAAALSRENPYLPTADLGAPQFVAEHPTFDGRGVGVALMSEHPNTAQSVFLSGARSLDGRVLPKFTRLPLHPPEPGDAAVDPHGTQVAAVLAGGRFLGGEATGVAPGAQILTATFDLGSIGAWVEAFAKTAQDERVDVITCSRTPNALPNDGETFLDLMLDRIVRRFNKPIVWAAGNRGPSLQSSLDGAAAPAVLAVGGYLSRATGRELLGYDPVFADNVWNESSRGPTSTGVIKPDVLAPSASIVMIPCWVRDWGSQVSGFRLPRCYAVSGGTSLAAPFAAGAIALLISGAKQTGLDWKVEDLLDALRHSARPLAGYGADQQGHGLIQVGAAWKLLTASPPGYRVSAFAGAADELRHFEKTPGAGAGIFERQGWRPGDRGERQVTLLRRDGPVAPLGCGLEWIANDGTFSAPASVTLPLNEPVAVPIRISPASAGVHSAVLRVLPQTGGPPVADVGATIVAAHALNADNGFTVHDTGLVPQGVSRSIFVEVPPGARALEIGLTPIDGTILFDFRGPQGASYEARQPNVFPPAVSQMERPASILVRDPYPGVWEFSVSTRGMFHADGAAVGYSMAVSLLGAAITPTSQPGRVEVRNTGAELGSAIVETGAGRRLLLELERSTLDRTSSRDLTVPPDTSLLTVAASAEGSEGESILNLYLYDCSRDDHCYLWDVASAAAGRQRLTVVDPPPGRWRALVDWVAGPPPQRLRYEEQRIRTTPPPPGPRPRRGVDEQWIDTVLPAALETPVGEGEPVVFVGVVDLAAERSEIEHPGYRWESLPRDRYRPIYLATSVFPTTATGHNPALAAPRP